MIKTALIMCGGKASRFNNVDKSLIKYKGKCIIEYLFNSLKRSEITRVILICNEKNKYKIEKLTKSYFKNYVIISNPPKRFRLGIKHAEKYLDDWFLFIAGNHPVESSHLICMKEKQKETQSWVVTLYNKKVSNENVFISRDENLKLIGGADFVMQHPLILSKEIIRYQKKENFRLKIEKTIKKLITEKNIYGIFGNFPPEFDNKEMLEQNKEHLKGVLEGVV